MNANELADEIKYITKVLNMNTDMDTKPLVESATMLRQQQAEIESLKAEKIRAYDNGYEDGRKPNTNKAQEK